MYGAQKHVASPLHRLSLFRRVSAVLWCTKRNFVEIRWQTKESEPNLVINIWISLSSEFRGWIQFVLQWTVLWILCLQNEHQVTGKQIAQTPAYVFRSLLFGEQDCATPFKFLSLYVINSIIVWRFPFFIHFLPPVVLRDLLQFRNRFPFSSNSSFFFLSVSTRA
jgi:hypothetical protein